MNQFSITTVLACLTAVTNAIGSRDVKIWSDCSSGTCKCGPRVHRIVPHCSEETVWIQPCYCMYYDQDSNETIVGNCLPTCYYFNFSRVESFYYPVARYPVANATTFNAEMCSPATSLIETNRKGRFCGRCKKGYGLAAYSYHYTSCIPCTDYGYKNWLRYFAVALLPLTLFYFLVVTLRISATSSRWNGLVLTLQVLTSPAQMRVTNGWAWARAKAYNPSMVIQSKAHFMALQISFSVVSFVNLDFFRTVYPQACLSPNLSILHILSLDYIVAVYPFFLILLTYLLVTMYDRNCRVLVWAWRPFRHCLRRYNRTLDVRASLIEAFASFILLSNVKILGVCFDLLLSTKAYNSHGDKLYPGYLYYDANIEFFSPQHLPFAILALLMGLVFVLVPFLLLVIYPCGCFQMFLNRFGCGCRALHVFMDAFQGSYRTEPRDLRYLSAFYLLLRFLTLLATTGLASVAHVPVMATIMVVGALVTSLCRPYKNSYHNTLDIVVMLSAALIYILGTADTLSFYLDYYWLGLIDGLFYLIPISVFSLYILLHIPYKKLQTVCFKILQWRPHRTRGNRLLESIETFDRENYLSEQDPLVQ